MNTCTQTFGPWTAISRVGATLLAPVSVAVDTTGLSVAVSAADLALVGAGRTAFVGQDAQDEAMATSPSNTPAFHKYINRPGSPPRGRLR